jgi:phosphoribosylglycinamide formyltransferase-1
MNKKVKIAILASGTGSNAEAIIKYFEQSSNIEVVCVGSNRKIAPVLMRAQYLNTSTFYQLSRKNETKEDYDFRLIKKLESFSPDWIILAGYMRLLTSSFLQHFQYQVINIHPSLLPEFPGAHAYEKAFEAKASHSGCTIHLVDEGMDTGKIIAQKIIPLYESDTLNDFKSRGLKVENEFYPQVLAEFLTNK